MDPLVVDQVCLWVAATIPIPLIIGLRWIGLALGVLVVWGSLVVAGILLSKLDPQRNMAILDAIWLLFGWIGGLLYCLPISGLREAVAWGMRRCRAGAANQRLQLTRDARDGE